MRTALLIAALMGVAGLLAAACGSEETPAPSPAVTQSAQTTDTPKATATPTASPTPKEVRQPEWTVEQQPSGADVTVVLSDGVNQYTVASDSAESAQMFPWSVAYDQDLDGDGVNEAIVSHYTGGAHCCSEYLIFDAGPAGIASLDSFSFGNAGIDSLKDLDGDGIPEMRSYDDRFAYFDDISYAASPFLPLILCRSADGTYTDCTPDFPDMLEESAQEYEGFLAGAPQSASDASDEDKYGYSLGLLASYMRLGREDEGWSKVAALCAECESWLRQNLADLEARLEIPVPYRDY